MIESRDRLRRRATRRALVILACAWFATAGDARAEEPRAALALNWIRLPGAENCIDAAELARTVEQQLGQQVFVSPTVATRVIEGWSEPTNPGWRAVLRSSDSEGNASGQRELTSASETCSSLNRFIVLAVSLLAQSARGISREPAEILAQAPRPAAGSVLAETPTTRTADRTARQTVPRLSAGDAQLGPTFDVGWGVLPGTAMGFGMRGTIAVSSAWMAELGATIWIPQQGPTGGPSVSFSRTDIAAGLCALLAAHKDTRLSACAGLKGSYIGIMGPYSNTSEGPYFGGYGRMVAFLGLSPLLWLTAAAGFGVPANVSTYYFDSAGAYPPAQWSMPFITASAEIGLVLHFGP